MASLTTDAKGRKRILFVHPDGKRRKMYLGTFPAKAANSLLVKVESLVSALNARTAPDPETARWVADLDQRMSDKLAAVDLIPRRESMTLAGFLDRYKSVRSDVKESTRISWGHTIRNLIEFFGGEKSLRSLSRGDAADWRLYLKEQKLSEPTIRKRCQNAKGYFAYAVKHNLIPSNPFADLKGGNLANPSRMFFITREATEKLIAAAPDSQWRCLIALARYGGLRTPSETLALKFSDINWETDRIHVTSVKTEHHAGKGSRSIPLFPELREHLRECAELAKPGSVYVIQRYRSAEQNLRTQFEKIIRRAGLDPWPRLFQNLRASCETELCQHFPIHVVTNWIGNSTPIALRHYLTVRDEDYEQAARQWAQSPSVSVRTVRESTREHDGEKSIFTDESSIVRDGTQVNSGRYWTRTSDLHDVNVAL